MSTQGKLKGDVSKLRAHSSTLNEGWHGWDEYADFYDWENAQTLDRRDVAFWQRMAQRAKGPILELGCGTGRVTIPVARTGAHVVGVDRSEEMLAYARRRINRARLAGSISCVRTDIRALPFKRSARFDLVMAPYGIVQSLIREADLAATIESVARVIAPRGVFGLDLVPDLPVWKEYRNRVRFRGSRRGGNSRITLVESVRQDRARKLTFFDQEFTEGWGAKATVRRFSLAFRTIGVPALRRRLERAGFEIDAVLGGYDGEAWDPRADTWVVLARRRGE